jgi:hypothetical protein
MPQHIEDLPGSVYDVVAGGGREHLDLLQNTPNFPPVCLPAATGGF